MSQDGSEARISLSAFQDATGQEEHKQNKAVELALQHHNQAAANAAMAIRFFRIVIRQGERTRLRDMLGELADALQEGYYASNSHDGRYLRDHLVKEHIIKGQGNAPSSFADRLLGKKPEGQQ